MRTLVRRILTVLALLLGMMWASQLLLTNNYQPTDRYVLSVTQTGSDGNQATWRFTVNYLLKTFVDSKPAAGAGDAVGRLLLAKGELKIDAADRVNDAKWSASRDAAGLVRMDGNAATMEDVTARIARDTAQRRTRPVTIGDVLDAHIPMPTRSKVSLPGFSYKQAFPDANDQPEIVITEYAEAPMVSHLRGASQVASAPAERANWDDWRKFYPQSLPPVEQRMPRNPAVVVGPDGVGQYGGMWRRCVTDMFDLRTKLCTESFMKRDPSGDIQPCLAYKWEASPDSRQYTLYLRKGHRWSDGEPWTTEDILWTCNVVIGSATFEPPDWMQARDGAQLLYEDDVSDWPELARRIVAEGNSPPSVGGRIKALGQKRLWACLQALAAPRPEGVPRGEGVPPLRPEGVLPSVASSSSSGASASFRNKGTAQARGQDARETQDALATAPALITADLNDLFRDPRFYSPQAFARVDANAELNKLRALGPSRLSSDDLERMLLMMERSDILRKVKGKDASTILDPKFRENPDYPTQSEIIRLNLLLFRSAYAGEANHPLVVGPAKDRVKVEAVADETGDTSHIIRFTFRKPNSLFIEHTPTFMFYRFLGGCKHTEMPLRPEGSKVLEVTDVLDWKGLCAKVLQQAHDPSPSPGQRLWAGLSEPMRRKLQAGAPRFDWSDSDKEEIVAAINQALAGRGFYDKAAFAGVDVSACRKQMHHNEEDNREMGYAEVFRDVSRVPDYGNWMVVEDLLKRLDRDGAASLSDAECLRLNVAAFRAAYSADAQKPLVARTRTDGLDAAAKKDPRKYDSWIARVNDRGNYHPQYNPHPPTLAPWRVVSEKDELEILAVRNPYYYKVDAHGNQLPYIDALKTALSAEKQIRILKMTGGNIDCQWRDITFDEYPVLKQNERNGDYEVRLWANDYCGEVCYGPLQAHKNPMFAKANEDANFRYALSLALNRQEIIDVVFYGLGEPAQFSIPKGSPYYSESMARQCVEYDPNRANRLLDAMGLDRRDEDGWRLFWNGTRFRMDVNTTKDAVPLPAIQLACKYWQAIGIDAEMKLRTNSMMYRLMELGDSDIEIGKEGGNYFGPFPPGPYYPSHPAESTQWYQWASYMRNGGRSGWPPPERIKELERMWQKMVESPDQPGKMAAWKAITDRFTVDLPIISVMTSPGRVVLVRNNFKNVPKIALAGWIAHEPGNACPECFFFDRGYKPPEKK